MNNSNKQVWVEGLRIVAILGVIILHVSDPIMSAPLQDANKNQWLIATFLSCAGSFCFPVLYMITGAFTLEKETESYQYFFKKTFYKLVFPLIIWVFMYGLFEKYYFKSDIDLFSWWLLNLNNGGGCFHLWFMYDIISIYLIIPIFRRFVQNASNDDLKYFLICWYLLVNVLPIFRLNLNLNFGLRNEYWTQQIGFVILGYYLKNKVSIPKISTTILVYVLMVGVQFSTYYYSAVKNGNYKLVEIDVVALQPLKASAIFLMFISIFKRREGLLSRLDNLMITIGECVYGIFFIHIMVLNVMGSQGWIAIISIEKYGLASYILGISFIVFLASFVIVYLFRKISIIKLMVP